MQAQSLIEVKNLKKYFPLNAQSQVHAVDDVSFAIRKGETLGLIGESGCGKSTLGRVLVRMYEQTQGEYYFSGNVVPNKIQGRWRYEFSRKVQMIFQDPYASLNPRMTVGDIIAEGPDIHGMWKGAERDKMIRYWLERVGLNAEHAARFPHEFSGGQRQRIGISRALALQPEFVVCDEPTSALDVSIQAQVINLLKDLQKEYNLTFLFIAHGLDMVRHISSRMAVMYLGQIVEIGDSETIYQAPKHPYSQALLNANPKPNPRIERHKERQILRGETSSPINPKPGCRFANRCPIATERCRVETPQLRTISEKTMVACHLV